jgi:hypothetical protein
MKRGIGIVLAIGALAASFALGRVQAQDDEENGKKNPMEDPEAWMELGKPGPEHAALQKMVGKWTCEVKSWQSPDADPMTDKGTTTFSMELGGLFLKQDYQGTMGGMPFKGIGYNGFDKATGKYEALWMDSMGSGIMRMTGTETEKGKVWNYKGHFFGPGGARIETRSVLRQVSNDEQTMEMYMDFGSGEVKSMEMTYKRAQ